MSEFERKDDLPAGADSVPPAGDDDFEVVVSDAPPPKQADTPSADSPAGDDGVPGGDDGDTVQADGEQPSEPQKRKGRTARRIERLERERDMAAQAAAHWHQEAERRAHAHVAAETARRATVAQAIDERANYLRAYNERLLEVKQHALNTGDAVRIANIDAEIAKTAAHMTQVERDRQMVQAQMPRGPMPQPQRVVPQQQIQQQPRPQFHEHAEAWMEQQSDWLSDSGNRQLAASIGQRVEARGLRPNTPDYWREVNRQIRSVDPEYEPFDPTGSAQRQQGNRPSAVAGVNRTAPGGASSPKRQVALTSEQMKFCEKHGISPKSYARELMAQSAAEPSGPKTIRI